MPAPERQAKRPFQASITSYFTSTQSTSPAQSQPAHAQCVPPLPAKVQSSLLNVGMRIRKSVPEGYKTGTYCGPGAVADHGSSSYATVGALASQSATDRRLTELTPYCGIMKVGGYALQPNNGDRKPASLGYEIKAFNSDELDFPDGSQRSTISTLSTDSSPPALQTINTHKRRLEEDSEDEVSETSFSPFIYEDMTLPPASLPSHPVSQISVTNVNLSRPRVQARSRRGAHQASVSRVTKTYIGDEGNVDAGVGKTLTAPHEDDFSEADFLLPPSWAVTEVEMAGI
ncbi:hypothetical protein GP486_005382 [Trichoglossum hirsutum]|uniref:Uncharacterized protein n=1 Tax=Trichoglossum hirsutum TaxID=265104 RepID=A0A9P8RMS0_9PEZI|nr:hypothetical protein GP486_005382 [Trichoglossum hirsutum]